MIVINNYDIMSAMLHDCYFIYMGEDSKKQSVIKMLKSQPIFFKSSFICRKPITDKCDIILSKYKWKISNLVKNYRCILILADLKIIDYFYELLDVCKELNNRTNEIFVIVTNDDYIVHGELRYQYEEFIKNHYIMGISLREPKQVLQESIKYVLYQQAIQYTPPTIDTFLNDLAWEFSLEYIK